MQVHLVTSYALYGRGAGVRRGRGVGVLRGPQLQVALGLGVGVPDAVAVAVAVAVGVAVGVVVEVGLAVGVGVGVDPPDCAQYLPPVLLVAPTPDDHFIASPNCRVSDSGSGRVRDAGGYPTIGVRIVSSASIHSVVTVILATPDNHFTPGPYCRITRPASRHVDASAVHVLVAVLTCSR